MSHIALPMRFESAASSKPAAPVEQNPTSSGSLVEKRKAALARSREIVDRKNADKRALEATVAENSKEGANDNARNSSPAEIIQRQEATRRRRMEMMTEMTRAQEEAEMRLALDQQSEHYINQQSHALGQAQAERDALTKKQDEMNGSFFKKTWGRLFGGAKKLEQNLQQKQADYEQKRLLLEGAQAEYFRNKPETIQHQKQAEALQAEADRLDQEISTFVSFEERPVTPEEQQSSPEDQARAALYESMSAEELKAERAAHKSERQILEKTLKDAVQSKERLLEEVQQVTQSSDAFTYEAQNIGAFLQQLNAEYEKTLKRIEDAQAKQAELSSNFLSKLLNKQQILQLEQNIKNDTTLIQGFDQHFVEAQTRIHDLNHGPQKVVADQKTQESSKDLQKSIKREEMAQKRLEENRLQLLEIDLALHRLDKAQAAPRNPPAEAPPSVQDIRTSINQRLRRNPRRPAVKNGDDQRLAA